VTAGADAPGLANCSLRLWRCWVLASETGTLMPWRSATAVGSRHVRVPGSAKDSCVGVLCFPRSLAYMYSIYMCHSVGVLWVAYVDELKREGWLPGRRLAQGGGLACPACCQRAARTAQDQARTCASGACSAASRKCRPCQGRGHSIRALRVGGGETWAGIASPVQQSYILIFAV